MTSLWDFKKIKKKSIIFLLSSSTVNITKEFPWWRNVLFEAWRNCWGKKDFIVWYSLSVFFLVLMCLFIIIVSVLFWLKKGNADYDFFECCEQIDETPSHFFLWSLFVEQHCFELSRAWRWLMNVWYCDLYSKKMNYWMIPPHILLCLNAWWMPFETMFINLEEWQTRISISYIDCTILYFVLLLIAVVSISFYSFYFIFHKDLICFCGRHYLSWWWWKENEWHEREWLSVRWWKNINQSRI